MASSQRQDAAVSPPDCASFNVDITRENFSAMLPVVQDALTRCTFYAFDCEMTGLFLETNRHEYLDDIQDRHEKMVESSKSFVINQYGLSAFERTGPDAYVARTFNFYLFPQPFDNYNRRFVCEAASMAFLASQGFDFNKCIYEGVPFMPARMRDWKLAQLERYRQSAQPEPRANPATATRPDDIAWLQDLVATVRRWVQDAAPGDQMELVLGFNGFKRMLAYQELEKDQFGVEGHPGFFVDRSPMADRSAGPPRVILRRMGMEEAAQMDLAALEARAAAIREAAGFAAVFDLMRASGKPGVGHNCMFDVAYALQGFAAGELPTAWGDFKALVAQWHTGGLWDTKYLARQLPDVFGSDTSLGDVFRALLHGEKSEEVAQLLQLASAGGAPADGASADELARAATGGAAADGSAGSGAAGAAADQGAAAATAAGGGVLRLPSVGHAPGFEKYRDVEAGALAHEAGYDAFMTGAAFACLLPLIQAKACTDPDSEPARARAVAAATAAAAAAPAAVDGGAAANGHMADANGSAPAAGVSRAGAGPSTDAPMTPAAAGSEAAMPDAADAAAGASGTSDPLQWVRPLVGRLNLGRTDMPYAALSGEDPLPERPTVFYLSDVEPGWRVGDVHNWLFQAGVGKARVTVLDGTSALIELEQDAADGALPKLQACTNFTAVPWLQYHAEKRARFAAQQAALQKQQQEQRQRRQQREQPNGGVGVGSKRQRQEEPAAMEVDEADKDPAGAARRSSCAIM